MSDDDLSDAIFADAQQATQKKLRVKLSRYLDAIPSLSMYRISFDTAIEVTIQSMVEHKDGDIKSCAELLIQAYPQHAEQIRVAAAISEIFDSASIAETLRSLAIPLELPFDFGPRLENGKARYELRDIIGAGTEGSVYLAMDRNLSDPVKPAWVAVKILPKNNQSAFRRLAQMDEATRARRINHPNVVRAVDRGVFEGRPFAVFEHVQGTPLDLYLDQKMPSPREIAKLMIGIAQGVQAIHSAGLVHCDLKPANILVDSDGNARIADFGLAAYQSRDIDASAPVAPSQGAHGYGTLAFVAPEQYRRTPGGLAPAADIYAIGGILFWLLTRRAPNGATPEEARRNLARQTGRIEPIRLQTFGKFDPDLAAICERAMHPDPAKRHSSAALIATDLQTWLAQMPVVWTRPSLGRRARLFVRREPYVLAACGVVVLVLLASAAGISWSISNARTQAVKAELKQVSQKAQDDANLLSVVRGAVATMRGSAMRAPIGEFGEGWLPLVSLMESITGPDWFSSDEQGQLWHRRIEVVHAMKESALERNPGGGIEALNYEFLEGFWLIQGGKYQESLTILESNLAKWQTFLDSQDPWIDYVRTARDVAAVFVLADKVEGVEAAQVEIVRQSLGEAVLKFADQRGMDPLRKWALRALVRLEAIRPGPDQKQAKEWRRQLQAMGEKLK